MNALELFAGSGSFGKVAERRGFNVFSVDIKPFDGIDLVKDIEFLTTFDVPFLPDVIWASPPCTTYSIAGISTHRDGHKPKTEFAKKSDRLLWKTLDICVAFAKCGEVKWFIENPVGMMRKMPMLKGFDRVTVDYCQYGDTRRKPTDIWTNHAGSLYHPAGWIPRHQCRNGETRCHHEAAPRGSRTGTQGLKGAYERSRIPEALITDIIDSLIGVGMVV
jgi:hypothetical protein